MNELTGVVTSTPEVVVQLTATGPAGPPGVSPHIGDNGNWWVGETDTGVSAQGGGGSTDHRTLRYRDAPGQHTLGAIEGLEAVLETIPAALTADELRKILK